MMNGMTVLAVILARSGSKRCPNKNFLPYKGTPLINLALDAAKASRYIDTVKLSLDADRPPELCTDTATSEDVLRYHLAKMPHDWVVLLQPTSPLRTVEDIDGCIETAHMGDGCISTLKGQPNGAVYVAKADWLMEHDFSHPGLFKYGMPADRSLDINEPEDFLK